MNSLLLQLGCVVLLFAIMWANRSGLVDPKLPLAAMAVVLLVWLLLAAYSLWAELRALYRHQQSALGFMLIGFSSIAFVVWGLLIYKGAQVPAIYDITTDTSSPPEFTHALSQRHSSHNPTRYLESHAPLQQQAYPHLVPLFLDLPFDKSLNLAAELVEAMGWQLHHIDNEKGLIEAYSRSQWMGFVDDIVIRVSPQDKGSRVDIRSASRIGQSDFGANAKRIGEFFGRLEQLANSG